MSKGRGSQQREIRASATNFHSYWCCSPLTLLPDICSSSKFFQSLQHQCWDLRTKGCITTPAAFELLNLCSVVLQSCARGLASSLLAGVPSCPKHRLGDILGLLPRHRQQSDGALVISRVSSEDIGFFTCIASNGRDRDQRQVLLRPLGTGWVEAHTAHVHRSGKQGRLCRDSVGSFSGPASLLHT